MQRDHHLLPVLAVGLGVATFSAMDMFMKSASISAGVFTAIVLRNLLGTAIGLPLWLWRAGSWPGAQVLRIHALRAGLVAGMSALFFWGLVRVPLAEAIAISFVGPLMALWFAALLLGERIRANAIVAALFGIAGVGVIAAGKLGAAPAGHQSLAGIGAILLSSVLYAANLVVQRKQALLASPYEVAFFQNLLVSLVLLAAAPVLLLVLPGPIFAWPAPATLAEITAAAVLATVSLLLLAWGYARAEAQVLVPVEYSGFAWAALLGWLWFGERLTATTLAGAVLVVIGSSIAARTVRADAALPPPAP